MKGRGHQYRVAWWTGGSVTWRRTWTWTPSNHYLIFTEWYVCKMFIIHAYDIPHWGMVLINWNKIANTKKMNEKCSCINESSIETFQIINGNKLKYTVCQTAWVKYIMELLSQKWHKHFVKMRNEKCQCFIFKMVPGKFRAPPGWIGGRSGVMRTSLLADTGTQQAFGGLASKTHFCFHL